MDLTIFHLTITIPCGPDKADFFPYPGFTHEKLRLREVKDLPQVTSLVRSRGEVRMGVLWLAAVLSTVQCPHDSYR